MKFTHTIGSTQHEDSGFTFFINIIIKFTSKLSSFLLLLLSLSLRVIRRVFLYLRSTVLFPSLLSSSVINMSSELVTVVLLGVSFFLVITPFQTGSMIQQVVTDSISQDYPDIKWNGYYSLCIIYFVFSMSNWIAPSTVSFIGCKWSMVFGALTYW